MLEFHKVRFPDLCFLINIFENLQSIFTENLQSNLKVLAVFAMTNIPNGTVERLCGDLDKRKSGFFSEKDIQSRFV